MGDWWGIWRSALSGRRAITAMGTIIGVVGMFVTTAGFVLPTRFLDMPGNPFAWVFLDNAASGAVLAVFWALLRAVPESARFVVALSGFLASGTLRTGLLYSEPWAGSFSMPFPLALGLNCAGAVVWFSIPAVLWDRVDRYRRTRAELVGERRALSAARNRNEARIDRIREAIVPVTGDEIPAALTGLARRVELQSCVLTSPDAAGTEELRALSADLRAYSEGVVRAVSHELADTIDNHGRAAHGSGGPLPSVGSTERSARPGPQSSAGAIATAEPFDPVPTAVVALLVVLVASVEAFGWWQGILAAGLATGAAVVVLGIANWLFGRRLPTWSVRRRGAVVAIVYLVAAALAATLPIPVFVAHLPLSYLAVLPVVVFAAFCVFCVLGGAFGAARRLASMQRGLRAAVAALRWESARAQHELDELRMQVADLLHGEVQGRLIAAAAEADMVAEGLETGQMDPTSAALVLSKAATELTAAGQDLSRIGIRGTRPSPHLGVRAGMEAIADAWDPVLTIKVEILPDDEEAIDASSACADAVVRILREAAANAFRHGGATRLDISVSVEDPWIRMCAEDDGVGLGWATRLGLGLATIGGPDGDLRLETGASGGARLVVEIPLS